MNIHFKGDDIDLNLSEKGSGKAVLLLQGWGTNTAVYERLTESMSAYCRVITYDIPGFGASSEPSFAFSTDDYGDFALAVLDKLDIKDVSLVGHSHGGRTILNLLSREKLPVSVEKAVLIDSAGIVPKKTFMQKLKIRKYKLGKALLSSAPVKALFPNALENYKNSHGSADYKAASEIMRASLVKVVNDDYTERISSVNVPTLLIWGDRDTATPISDAHIMEKKIRDCGLVTVAGGSHYSFLDNPNLVYGALRSFFGGIRL